jgi:hypothetical protein
MVRVKFTAEEIKVLTDAGFKKLTPTVYETITEDGSMVEVHKYTNGYVAYSNRALDSIGQYNTLDEFLNSGPPEDKSINEPIITTEEVKNRVFGKKDEPKDKDAVETEEGSSQDRP